MSANIKTLKDADGSITYPQTLTSAVYDSASGKMLSVLLSDGTLGGNAHIEETLYSCVTTDTALSFTIPDFDSSTMVLDVYINGLHCIPTADYTVDSNVVTLVNTLEADQKVEFVVRKVKL